jgi:hypothetical protein
MQFQQRRYGLENKVYYKFGIFEQFMRGLEANRNSVVVLARQAT